MLRYFIVIYLLFLGCASCDDGKASQEDFILANQWDYISKEDLKELKN